LAVVLAACIEYGRECKSNEKDLLEFGTPNEDNHLPCKLEVAQEKTHCLGIYFWIMLS